MSVAIRTIKTTLKSFENPRIEDAYLVVRRIQDVDPYITQVKKSYPREFVVFKTIIIGPNGSMPTWVYLLLADICLYLDCYILHYTHLPTGEDIPVKALMTIGEEEQLSLVHHYISYIVNSVELFGDRFRAKTKKEAKRARREYRESGGLFETHGNVKKQVSDYKRKLAEDIQKILRELLEKRRNEDKVAFYNGIQHRSFINKYLTQKYGWGWKTKASNTGS